MANQQKIPNYILPIIVFAQFSTIVAKTAPSLYIGTALTIVNCIGFALTIVSIQILNYLQGFLSVKSIFLMLLIGPLIGLYSIRKIFKDL